MRKWAEWLVSPALYVLAGMILLYGMLGDFGEESASMTPFYTNDLFVSQMQQRPWGMLVWLSSGLMSCYALPWLGALLTLAVGVLLACAIQGTLRLSRSLAPLCYIPSCLLLIPYVSEGYGLYIHKSHGDEFLWLIALAMLFATLWLLRGLLGRFVRIPRLATERLSMFALSLILLVGSGAYVWSRTCMDRNFHVILQMKHVAQQSDWQGILNLSTQQSQQGGYTPTRAQVLLVRLALHRLGLSGESTYSYPDGDATFVADVPHQYLRLILGQLLYYQYGRLRFAYRWAMEDMIEYGMRPAYLDGMARVSAMQGEWNLVRKYAQQLSHSPWYRDAAQRYMAMVDEPSLVEQDTEMAAIAPLVDQQDILDGDGGLVESYLLQSFSNMRGGTPQQEQMALDCALVQKDIANFWPHFANLAMSWQKQSVRIPRHYQEAALLFSALQGQVSLDGLDLDPAICQRFDELTRLSNENSQMGDEYNAQALRGNFGDTYWYYFFFVRGIKTQ